MTTETKNDFLAIFQGILASENKARAEWFTDYVPTTLEDVAFTSELIAARDLKRACWASEDCRRNVIGLLKEEGIPHFTAMIATAAFARPTFKMKRYAHDKSATLQDQNDVESRRATGFYGDATTVAAWFFSTL